SRGAGRPGGCVHTTAAAQEGGPSPSCCCPARGEDLPPPPQPAVAAGRHGGGPLSRWRVRACPHSRPSTPPARGPRRSPWTGPPPPGGGKRPCLLMGQGLPHSRALCSAPVKGQHLPCQGGRHIPGG
ncbi:unnamed protein product, partial [Discosporangium mesarthrocarpum]